MLKFWFTLREMTWLIIKSTLTLRKHLIKIAADMEITFYMRTKYSFRTWKIVYIIFRSEASLKTDHILKF